MPLRKSSKNRKRSKNYKKHYKSCSKSKKTTNPLLIFIKSSKPKKPRSKKQQSGGKKQEKKKDKQKQKECPPNMSKIKTQSGLLCVGKCPHSGGPIYYNPSTDKLVCKWHGSQFDSKSGKVLTPPAQSKLKIIKQK